MDKIVIFLCGYFLCGAVLITCKKINSRNIDKIDECKKCKILTNSFNHWLDKTSRGKFEGGDAAWEEAKLKSYSRSEIRLVEVQEGLCSELKKHQGTCYSIAEEAEMLLEKWWFHEDPNSVDIYTWLCIDTMKNCCPQKHFGESCTLCPVDDKNIVCSGNGKCDGDGTRKGNGSCTCNKGFVGVICENCEKQFYKDGSACKSCHKACDECSDKGAAACIKCKTGWSLESGVCVDINECLDSSLCSSSEYCVNLEGSYSCKTCDKSCKTCLGEGSTNCTSCKPNSALWSGSCVDDNLRRELLSRALRRLALYIGLLLITSFVVKHSKLLASLVIIAIAIDIYFTEKSLKMRFIDLFANAFDYYYQYK